jgi:hypothetical protein
MVESVRLPIVIEAEKIYDQVREIMEPFDALTWMMKGNEALDGHSPVTAMKADRTADVQELINKMRTK